MAQQQELQSRMANPALFQQPMTVNGYQSAGVVGTPQVVVTPMPSASLAMRAPIPPATVSIQDPAAFPALAPATGARAVQSYVPVSGVGRPVAVSAAAATAAPGAVAGQPLRTRALSSEPFSGVIAPAPVAAASSFSPAAPLAMTASPRMAKVLPTSVGTAPWIGAGDIGMASSSAARGTRTIPTPISVAGQTGVQTQAGFTARTVATPGAMPLLTSRPLAGPARVLPSPTTSFVAAANGAPFPESPAKRMMQSTAALLPGPPRTPVSSLAAGYAELLSPVSMATGSNLAALLGNTFQPTAATQVVVPQTASAPIAATGAGNVRVLETDVQRKEFLKELTGKNVLHVKGFGSSFKEPTPVQQGIEQEQTKQALLAIQAFAPDFLVVDGDPWGSGFQVYAKKYIDQMKISGQASPTLIVAKNVKLVGDERRLDDSDEKGCEKRLKQLREWAEQGFSVVAYWVDEELLSKKIDEVWAKGFVEDFKTEKHSKRGLVKILSGTETSWTKGISCFLRDSISDIEDPSRGDKQYFEKCSFENSAKGNLIFDIFHDAPAKHGVACFGGGESVLLEVATKYLNKSCAAMQQDVAVFPFSRGREDQDPVLPSYCGASFNKDQPKILATVSERQTFTQLLAGKRVLHVKGFGGGFKDPSKEQEEKQKAQRQQALTALKTFAPDFVVVDGDPWGEGFQVYLKEYNDYQRKTLGQVPKLIWAKNVKLEAGCLIDDEERKKRQKQAAEWAAQGFSVAVYWIDAESLDQKINELYGSRFVQDNSSAKFNARGLVNITNQPELFWVNGMSDNLRQSVLAIEHPDRGNKQFFEKCSFENSAKGNLIFDFMHLDSLAKHGVACFGGGESVLLELATQHLNTSSGSNLEDVLVLPFSRGREGDDPALPRHVGASYGRL